MSVDALERELQDYLDGRLPEAARAAFESRLADDAELARRVEIGREIRGALREETDPVSPGFYTRARARFEESRRPRRWFRPLSWETAGLTAAVAIAAVLFIPRLSELELPGSTEGARPSNAESKQVAAADLDASRSGERRADVEQEKPESAVSRDETDDRIEVSKLEREKRPSRRESGRQAPLPGDASYAPFDAEKGAEGSEADAISPLREAPPSRQANESARDAAGAVEEALPSKESERVARSSASQQAPSAAPQAPSVLAVPPEPEFKRARVEAGEVAGSGAATVPQARVPVFFALPRGAVGFGELRTLRTREEWAWLERLGGEEEADAAFGPGGFEAGYRIVLVGPRSEPFRCSGSRVVIGPDRHEIVLGATADLEDAAEWGCGVLLPADGRPFSIVAVGPGD